MDLIRRDHYNYIREQKKEDQFATLLRSIEEMVCHSEKAGALIIRIDIAKKKNETMKEFDLITQLRILLKFVSINLPQELKTERRSREMHEPTRPSP